MRTYVTGNTVIVTMALFLVMHPSVVAQDADSIPLRDDPDLVRPDLDDAANTQSARDTIPIQSLLLWGGIHADGAPFLEPVFVIEAPPSLPDATGDYRVGGRADDGTVLFSLDFEMPVIADGDGSSSFLLMLPVQPGWEGRLASVTLTGPGGSTSLDEDSHRPMAILRDPATGRIRGILRDLPPSIETQAMADTAVARDPGIEVLFSRGIPGPGAWRR